MRDPAGRGGLGGSGPLYALDGVAPRIAADAWIAPTAVVIGDVEIGPGSSVWFHSVLRGDSNFIRVGARSNIQDGTIVHVDPGEAFATIIGDDVTVGHAAIIHGCRLHDRVFVAMGAIVQNGAVIEEGGVLGAGALLAEGKRIGPNELWVGAPARLKRVLTAADRPIFDHGARHYAANAIRFRAGLRGLD
jgi:gamma-carbonic anhydrase